MSPLTIEQRLTAHELEDERRHGIVQTHLTRIEGKIDVLSVQILEARKVANSAEDMAEITGSYRLVDAEKTADFWKKLIAGIMSALVIAIISGLTTYFVTHR